VNKIREDANKNPISHILIIVLLTVGVISLPLDFATDLFIKNKKISLLLAQIIIRSIVIIFAIILLKQYRFAVLKKFSIKSCIVMIILALVVAINNFPIIGLIKKDVVCHENVYTVLLFCANCLIIAITEELVFRGIIFPLCIIAISNRINKPLTQAYKNFWCVVISSGFFALTHLVNLFSGASIGAVSLQVGYSFLIGAMLAICMLETKNVLVCVVIHFVYNVGGLLCQSNIGVAQGIIWDNATMIITAIIGVVVLVYFFVKILKSKANANELLNETIKR